MAKVTDLDREAARQFIHKWQGQPWSDARANRMQDEIAVAIAEARESSVGVLPPDIEAIEKRYKHEHTGPCNISVHPSCATDRLIAALRAARTPSADVKAAVAVLARWLDDDDSPEALEAAATLQAAGLLTATAQVVTKESRPDVWAKLHIPPATLDAWDHAGRRPTE